jgi:hypothetical protein
VADETEPEAWLRPPFLFQAANAVEGWQESSGINTSAGR